MATFEFEIVDTSVLDGVTMPKRPVRLNYPANKIAYNSVLQAAAENKGLMAKFVTLKGLTEDEASEYRADVYALDMEANGKNTLRSRIRPYKSEDGTTKFMLMIRALTDDEMDKKVRAAERRAKTREDNKINA